MLLYITFVDFRAFFAQGVHRKIQGQVKAMERQLDKVYYMGWSYPKAVLMKDEGQIVEIEPAVTTKDYIEVIKDWIKKYDVEQTYIRYSKTSKWLLDLLIYQRTNNIKTVLEITSYPYDIEAAEGIIKSQNDCYNAELYKYFDRITTYSSHKNILGVSSINLVNGVDIDKNPISLKEKSEKDIVFITVSSMQTWQGYERFIEGIYLYYKNGGKYDIRFKMIGSGPEENYYKTLVDKYQLQSRVEFLGQIELSEKKRIDQQYDLSDIAVGTLGVYKQMGTNEGSPIKGAEYCARGIPFICGYHDLRFPPDWEYILNVPNNAEPIDMNQVIDFYEKVTAQEHYKESMRDYAIKYLTWDKIMEPVVAYFKA